MRIAVTAKQGDAMGGYITAPRKRRILYVEDNRTSQVFVKAYFENHGYVLDAVSDVIQALIRLINIKYDAIVLDYHLPVTSPEEAEHSLRKARVPICYFTCDPDVKSTAPDIPLVNKLKDVDNGGLDALERTLVGLMDGPLADDYDKTRHITAEELEEIRGPASKKVWFHRPGETQGGMSQAAHHG